MAKPDRTKFARENAAWLTPAFGAVLLFGILNGSLYAIAGGVSGLIWVGAAVWTRR